MSDFGSGIERYGPRFELSGRASKADLRRRIAALEAENERLRSRRLPYREAEVAQKRYEDAEAENERLRVCGSCHMWKPVADADDTYCCTCIIIGSDPAYPHSRCDRWVERSTR